jgi:Reverse transcriptase (RNA-dependent DNA polymerase)
MSGEAIDTRTRSIRRGCGEAFRAHVVSYADDFVILSRGRAAEALTWTKAVMTKLGLTINETKTSLRNAREERFNFLGYSFPWRSLALRHVCSPEWTF